jgi:hypothetical protein
MSVRTELLVTADEARALRGPAGVDIETVNVTIVRRTWAGGRRGSGAPTDVAVVTLPIYYKIRQVSERLVASSGGLYTMNDIKVGPITPSFSGGGFSPADLKPVGLTGQEIVYVLSGALVGEYALINLDTTRPFRYTMILRRTSP